MKDSYSASMEAETTSIES